MNSLQFKPLKPWVGFGGASRMRDYRSVKTNFMLGIEITLYATMARIVWRD